MSNTDTDAASPHAARLGMTEEASPPEGAPGPPPMALADSGDGVAAAGHACPVAAAPAASDVPAAASLLTEQRKGMPHSPFSNDGRSARIRKYKTFGLVKRLADLSAQVEVAALEVRYGGSTGGVCKGRDLVLGGPRAPGRGPPSPGRGSGLPCGGGPSAMVRQRWCPWWSGSLARRCGMLWPRSKAPDRSAVAVCVRPRLHGVPCHV